MSHNKIKGVTDLLFCFIIVLLIYFILETIWLKFTTQFLFNMYVVRWALESPMDTEKQLY